MMNLRDAGLHTLLDRLEIGTGDAVFLHSSYSRLRWTGLSPEGVIELLLDRLGPSGTLAMPTYAWHLDPTRRPWAGFRQYFERRPAFDVRRPSNMGVLTEAFRNRSNSHRSLDYWWSVCVSGPHAMRLAAGQDRVRHYCGPDSAFQRLVELDVVVLGMGVTLNTTSLALLVDYALGPQHRSLVFTPTVEEGIVVDGDGTERTTMSHWLLPDVVRYIEPKAVYDGCATLRAETHTAIVGDSIFFSYPFKTYHESALTLAAGARARSTPVPWLRRYESYRVSRRPHCLGGWGLWDVQVGFLRKCANVPSGGSRSTGRPTPQRGRCCSRWRRSSAARRRRCGRGCGRRSVMLGIGRA